MRIRSVFLFFRKKLRNSFDKTADQNGRNQCAFADADNFIQNEKAQNGSRQDEKAVEKHLDASEGFPSHYRNGEHYTFAWLNQSFRPHLKKDAGRKPYISDQTHAKSREPGHRSKRLDESHAEVNKSAENQHGWNLQDIPFGHGLAQQQHLCYVTLMLSSEFSELNNVNLVLTALAKGIGKFTDILEATKIAKSPTLADCLARLTAMGLVVKDAPINDERNKRRVIYRIADPMTAFYYRFVFPKKSLLQLCHYWNFFEDFVKDEFENEYMPLALEEVVRQFLTLRNKAGLIDPPLTRMGRYVYQLPSMRRPREIRFVTEDQNGYCYYDLSFKPKEMKVESVVRTIEQVKASPLDARRFVFFVRKREYWYDYRLNEVSVEQHTVHEFYTKMQ